MYGLQQCETAGLLIDGGEGGGVTRVLSGLRLWGSPLAGVSYECRMLLGGDGL